MLFVIRSLRGFGYVHRTAAGQEKVLTAAVFMKPKNLGYSTTLCTIFVIGNTFRYDGSSEIREFADEYEAIRELPQFCVTTTVLNNIRRTQMKK